MFLVVSTMWLNAAAGMAQQWGISPSLMCLLIGMFAAIGAAGAFEFGTNGLGGEHHKDLAVAMFFIMLCIEGGIGLVDWVFIIVPVILVGGLMWQGRSNK